MIGVNTREEEGEGAGEGEAHESLVPLCTVFKTAILGISASKFEHAKLVQRIKYNMLHSSSSSSSSLSSASLSKSKSILDAPQESTLPQYPRVLFVSRNHHSVVRGRKIVNEAEVVQALNATVQQLSNGHQTLHYIQMETLLHVEQVNVSSRTQIMISPHGAGLANCIWMPSGSMFVEFVAPVGKTLLDMYKRMCSRSGVEQIRFLAEADPADEKLSDAEMNNNRRLFSNMIVPPERIVEALKNAWGRYKERRKTK